MFAGVFHKSVLVDRSCSDVVFELLKYVRQYTVVYTRPLIHFTQLTVLMLVFKTEDCPALCSVPNLARMYVRDAAQIFSDMLT